MKRQSNGLIDLTGLDPSIAATISIGAQRQAQRSMPNAERKKVAREKAKLQARKEKRVTYDIAPAIIRDLADLAEHYQTPASQLAGLALALFLAAIERGDIDLKGYLIPIQNPRYAYLVNWTQKQDDKF